MKENDPVFLSAGHLLASFEENTRNFLFPEPKLVPPFSGVDREALMVRAPYFPVGPKFGSHQARSLLVLCRNESFPNLESHLVHQTHFNSVSYSNKSSHLYLLLFLLVLKVSFCVFFRASLHGWSFLPKPASPSVYLTQKPAFTPMCSW